MTISEIDALFDENLRKAVINSGYLVDETLYTTNAEYQTALTTLRATLNSKESIINIFGVGSSWDRGGKDMSSFVIDRKGLSKGNVGLQGVRYHVHNVSDKFDKYKSQASNYSIDYDIRVITKSTFMERLMINILYNLLSTNEWLFTVNSDRADTTERVEIIQQAFANVSIGNEYIEWVGNYMVKDVQVFEDSLVDTNISPLNTTQLTINAQYKGLNN